MSLTRGGQTTTPSLFQFPGTLRRGRPSNHGGRVLLCRWWRVLCWPRPPWRPRCPPSIPGRRSRTSSRLIQGSETWHRYSSSTYVLIFYLIISWWVHLFVIMSLYRYTFGQLRHKKREAWGANSSQSKPQVGTHSAFTGAGKPWRVHTHTHT